MVPAAGLDDVGTDREVLDSYHYVTPGRQSQAIDQPVFRDPPQSPIHAVSKKPRHVGYPLGSRLNTAQAARRPDPQHGFAHHIVPGHNPEHPAVG